MLDKKNKTKKSESMYFTEAIDEINEGIEYNENDEINNSGYIKNILNKEGSEIENMISCSLLLNDKLFLNNLSLNMLKKKKDILLRNKQLGNEKNQQRRNTRLIQRNSNTNIEMLNINIDKNKLKLFNNKKDKNQIHNLKSIDLLPKINSLNKTNTSGEKYNSKKKIKIKNEIIFRNFDRKDILLTDPGKGSKSLKDKTIINRRNKSNLSNINEDINFIIKKDRSIINSKKNYLKNYNSTREIMNNIFKEVKKLKSFEEKETENIEDINNYKKEENINLKNRVYKDNETQMKTFLVENIDKLNKDKNNKEEKIIREYIQLKLKKDPIVKISEKFAYFNRKPLLNLFNFDIKKKKMVHAPLTRLRIKDKKIMKSLEKDNRTKDLLMKRIDKDQDKYNSGGYFFTDKDNDNNYKKNIFKNTFNIENNDNDDDDFLKKFNFTKIRRITPFET